MPFVGTEARRFERDNNQPEDLMTLRKRTLYDLPINICVEPELVKPLPMKVANYVFFLCDGRNFSIIKNARAGTIVTYDQDYNYKALVRMT